MRNNGAGTVDADLSYTIDAKVIVNGSLTVQSTQQQRQNILCHCKRSLCICEVK